MNYDPNMTSSGRMAKQTVKMTFQQWNYKAEIEKVVGGNCTGMTVIGHAVGMAYETLEEVNMTPFILMINGDGDRLHCGDDEEEGEDWLRDMLVKAEITAIEADK